MRLVFAFALLGVLSVSGAARADEPAPAEPAPEPAPAEPAPAEPAPAEPQPEADDVRAWVEAQPKDEPQPEPETEEEDDRPQYPIDDDDEGESPGVDSALVPWIVLGAGFLAADAAFGSYDTVMIARGEPPSFGVGLSESLVGGLQVLSALTFLPISASGLLPDDVAGSVLIGLSLVPSVQFVHGIWSAVAVDGDYHPDRVTMLGVSTIVGVNAPLTLMALVHMGIRGAALTPPYATLELVGGLGSLGGAVAGTVLSDARGPWGVLIGWSSLLALHGALSLALGGDDDDTGAVPLPLMFPTAIDTQAGPAPAVAWAGAW
jgi:hypothetical protein